MADKYVDISYNTDVNSFGTPKQLAATITAISKAASAVVTAANDFAINDVIAFASVGGMTEINGLTGTVSAATSTTFTVGINSTGFTTYTSGGVGTKQMATDNSIRFIYDDTVDKTRLYLAAQRFREWVARTLTA